MDPIETIDINKDSTLAMLWAAAERGWSLYVMQQTDLFWHAGEVKAQMWPIQVSRGSEPAYQLGEKQTLSLQELQVVLMRKDPPVDNAYFYATYLLEAAAAQGTWVVNKPQSLRDCNEKLFTLAFPQCCPPMLVSADKERLMAFQQEQGDVIYKPLDGMGGASIFRVKSGDPNHAVILETLTQHGQVAIMAQRYLAAVTEGDKRVLLIDGEPIPYALARIPRAGETRANLAAGGSAQAQPLSDRDRWIVEQVAPTLKAKGLLFVGLDIIGDYLTEINVTSPTCIRQLDQQVGTDVAGQLMACIADKLGVN